MLGRLARTDLPPGGRGPLAAPVPPSQVAAGIAAATQLGQTADGKQILLATCTADSPLLLELGRLRELTFRQVGEGTGRSRDLDDLTRGTSTS